MFLQFGGPNVHKKLFYIEKIKIDTLLLSDWFLIIELHLYKYKSNGSWVKMNLIHFELTWARFRFGPPYWCNALAFHVLASIIAFLFSSNNCPPILQPNWTMYRQTLQSQIQLSYIYPDHYHCLSAILGVVATCKWGRVEGVRLFRYASKVSIYSFKSQISFPFL